MLSPDQIRKYFETRLGKHLSANREVMARCPFHEDGTASLSINTEKGVWKCHAGCGEGGMVAFEMKFSNRDADRAKDNIRAILGLQETPFSNGERPEAVYQYRDASGAVVFEKLRMPGKKFVQRRPTANGQYEYKLGDCSKPLYKLPQLLTANEIFVCEGEKDADAVDALGLGQRTPDARVTATTNFDGSGKWRDEYSVYFAGKRVAILPDNDEPGEKHALRVAESIYPYALGVKIVRLPGLAEKGDVSDYLKGHTADDLLTEVQQAPRWHPADKDSGVIVPIMEHLSKAQTEIDWLVQGVVQRGANGFFCAVPKGGKSWSAIDMAISLSLGCHWLGFNVPKPVRVALISREDAPELTSWRIRHLLAGKPPDVDLSRFERNLYINTRRQSDEFMLDNEEEVRDLVAALKQRKIEFAIFDVFNVMHAADENDNTEMRGVLRQLSAIQTQVGCGIGVVHHFNKTEGGSMTQRLRGSSAIAGWAEWLIGLSMAEEGSKTRKMEFELKAAQPPDAVHFRIDSNETAGVSKLVRTDWVEPPAVESPGQRAFRLMQEGVQ